MKREPLKISVIEYHLSQLREEEEDILYEIREKSWTFVELEKGEENKFSEPENPLEDHTIPLIGNGYGKYIAYGKHTGEEFWTEKLPFAEIVSQYTANDAQTQKNEENDEA